MATKRRDGRREQEQAREAAILRATLAELAGSDYGSLSIEGVAHRVGVNKTTIYRKWPTKAELVLDALRSVTDKVPMGPSTGNLRDDLRQFMRQVLAFTESAEGQSLLRMPFVRAPEPELAQIGKQLGEAKFAQLCEQLSPAIARGEMAQGADVRLLLDMLWGVVLVRVVQRNEVLDDATMDRTVEMLLAAARAEPVRRPAPRKRRAAG